MKQLDLYTSSSFLILILANTLVKCDVGEDLSIIYQEPQVCNLQQNETFSWTSLSCVKCQWKNENNPDCNYKNITPISSFRLHLFLQLNKIVFGLTEIISLCRLPLSFKASIKTRIFNRGRKMLKMS